MSEVEHLSHDEFFARMTKLYRDCHANGHGTVALSQKRFTHGNQKMTDNPLWDLDPPAPLPIIIRASNAVGPVKRKAGAKVKISTIVQPHDIESFYTRYADVCKRGMEGLRKRDRSKKKKDRKRGKIGA